MLKLYEIHDLQISIFSPILKVVFSLDRILIEKYFNFDAVQFIHFFLPCLYFRCHEDVDIRAFLKVFVLALIFKSLTHFELIFICGLK